MNTEKKLIPLLRFPEYTYANSFWLENNVGDSIKTLSPPKKLQSNDYKRSGKYPIIDQSQGFICGYSDDNSAVINKNSKELIVFGDHTCVLKFIDFPFIQGADGIKIFEPKSAAEIDVRYLYQYLVSSQIESKEYKRHFSELKEKIFLYPKTIKEQTKIADCLFAIDTYISFTNEKVEQLKAHKKSLLQKLFPQNGENVPEYRFPEFKELGMWTENTLGDIGDVCMCKRIMKDETNINYSIPFYKIGTFGKKADTYITEEQFNEYKAKYSYPQKGDILFSAAGTIGRYVEFDGEPAYFQDSNIVWIANDETLVCNKFLKYLYSKVQWNIDDGGVVKRLYNESIKKTSIHIPSMSEQRKIAGCLSSIDEAITLYSEKVSLIEQHKKGLMQQLFPTPK